ncbi:uncharacterized protein si:ch211-197h24.6 [Betta splendens]|uniref:Uncharacterized protein si:ch211-197h24.6 n=1 Tax=Betta splendens TaxID=158456 RepID=A0A6P7KTN7_BETSP|nr:uncharacterized protein si:ch211-197h24.6 [Betta splendens]
METQTPMNQPLPQNGPQENQNKNARRKQLQDSADIVFLKGASIQSMPSLGKQLNSITECVIGLQYVWEYRSPSKTVPPHYQCKLCAVSRLQHDMLAHVKGWKHSFKYLKRIRPDKVAFEEEDAIKDPAIRKNIKDAAAEVEQTEGRGQLKVILKEPCDVPGFKGFRTATPKVMPPLASGMGFRGSSFFPRFFDLRFPSQGGPISDFPIGEYGKPSFGGFQKRQDFLDSSMDQRTFPYRCEDNFEPGVGRDSFGRSGMLEENPGRMYPDEYRGGHMGGGLMDQTVDKPLNRPGLMGAAPDHGNLSNTLLTYLDTFRIENENDAQLVLKVTQKLTDVLMEYRLRSISAGSSLNNLSMNSTGFSSSSSILPSGTDRYSSSLSGPSRFSDGPPRYYR